jgi:serine/threonine protein kinase
MKKLRHKNIVQLIESFETENEVCIVMEFVEGVSLYSYLKQQFGAKFDEAKARNIFSQIIEVVFALHKENIFHGDLKLENILITPLNNVVLIDFGFSGYCDIMKTVCCGTAEYLSPEIVSLHEFYGGPADIWALGVILYTLISGSFPFKAANNKELYKKIVKGLVKLPRTFPAGPAKLISKILKTDPKNRPSIENMANDSWLIKPNSEECIRSISVNSACSIETHSNISKRRGTISGILAEPWKTPLKKLMTLNNN